MVTKIQWTKETWNPIIGCSKVSQGCENCYAERMAVRLANIPKMAYYQSVTCPGPHQDPKGWNGKTHLVESALQKPFNWKKPRTIFVCSMGDLFHESVPFEWVDKVIDVIRWTKRHTYLFLTKRPERMADYFMPHVWEKYIMDNGVYLDNLWLGVTAENQEQADERIPILLDIPARKRFVSIEPMLSEINLTDEWRDYLEGWNVEMRSTGGMPLETKIDTNNLNWVICGAESGPRRREMQTQWAIYLKNQCIEAGVPFFFKQKFEGGKKITMPELDGQIWNQKPCE